MEAFKRSIQVELNQFCFLQQYSKECKSLTKLRLGTMERLHSTVR